MTTVKSLRALVGILALFATAQLGCQSEGSESSPPGSVCPSCDPRAGGETSDFGGGVTECGALSKAVAIDASEVDGLGFDLAELRRRIERPIDVSLQWVPQRGDGGGESASGFAAKTNLHANVVITSFAHDRPDPALCDGTTCEYEEIVVEQARCPHFLRMNIEVELSTADGAVQATATGEAAHWAQGFEDVIGDDTADYPVGHAYADLREVRGTLELTPAIDDPFEGTLVLVLHFEAGATQGELWPELQHQLVDDAGTVQQLQTQRPLIGYFPASRAVEPGEADAVRVERER